MRLPEWRGAVRSQKLSISSPCWLRPPLLNMNRNKKRTTQNSISMLALAASDKCWKKVHLQMQMELLHGELLVSYIHASLCYQQWPRILSASAPKQHRNRITGFLLCAVCLDLLTCNFCSCWAQAAQANMETGLRAFCCVLFRLICIFFKFSTVGPNQHGDRLLSAFPCTIPLRILYKASAYDGRKRPEQTRR